MNGTSTLGSKDNHNCACEVRVREYNALCDTAERRWGTVYAERQKEIAEFIERNPDASKFRILLFGIFDM